MSTVLVSTDYGVVSAKPLNPEALRSLALWLCSDKGHHEHSSISVEAWERQVERNGGYCDCCRDFAGEILANFDLHQDAEAINA